MTTVQIVGIAVASAVVVILVIALVVTRHRAAPPEEPQAEAAESVIGETPRDTFTGLGKAEQPVEDVTLDPTLERETQTNAAPSPRAETVAEVTPPAPDAPAAGEAAPAAEAAPGAEAAAEPAVEPAGAGAPAEPSSAGHQTMPLSEIIVTTSNKMVDLEDPEVRRMLTDLVKFEIDQATQFRQQGQTIDALLQLTEAEKISRALGMEEAAERIRDMMREMRGQT